MNARYDDRQVTYCLSSIASLPSDKHGTVMELEAYARAVTHKVFANSTIVGLIGEWDLVWGPKVYQVRNSTVADNAMYVARSREEPARFVVAISGTNPISAYGWIVEDIKINPPVTWPYGDAGPAVRGDIAYGTNVGLKVVLNTLRDDNFSLFEYLAGQVSGCQGPLSITVTGHSLGGALSPATALALRDTQGVPLGEPNGWDPSAKSRISCLPTAGPTPGNETWRDYYDGRLGKATDRLWNAIDIVPHAWQISMLNEIPTIYQPEIPASDFVRVAARIAVANSVVAETLSGSGMRQICPSVPGLPGKVDPDLTVTVRHLIVILETLLANDLIQKLAEELKLAAWEVALIKATIDELIRYLNGEKTAGAKVDETVLDEVDTENATALRSRNGDLFDSLKDLIGFLIQVAYQHTTAYDELIGTTEFSGIVSVLAAETPFPPPAQA